MNRSTSTPFLKYPRVMNNEDLHQVNWSWTMWRERERALWSYAGGRLHANMTVNALIAAAAFLAILLPQGIAGPGWLNGALLGFGAVGVVALLSLLFFRFKGAGLQYRKYRQALAERTRRGKVRLRLLSIRDTLPGLAQANASDIAQTAIASHQIGVVRAVAQAQADGLVSGLTDWQDRPNHKHLDITYWPAMCVTLEQLHGGNSPRISDFATVSYDSNKRAIGCWYDPRNGNGNFVAHACGVIDLLLEEYFPQSD